MVRQIAQIEACLLELKFSFKFMALRMSMVMGNLGLDAVWKTGYILFKTEDKIQLFERGFGRPQYLCNKPTKLM